MLFSEVLLLLVLRFMPIRSGFFAILRAEMAYRLVLESVSALINGIYHSFIYSITMHILQYILDSPLAITFDDGRYLRHFRLLKVLFGYTLSPYESIGYLGSLPRPLVSSVLMKACCGDIFVYPSESPMFLETVWASLKMVLDQPITRLDMNALLEGVPPTVYDIVQDEICPIITWRLRVSSILYTVICVFTMIITFYKPQHPMNEVLDNTSSVPEVIQDITTPGPSSALPSSENDHSNDTASTVEGLPLVAGSSVLPNSSAVQDLSAPTGSSRNDGVTGILQANIGTAGQPNSELTISDNLPGVSDSCSGMAALSGTMEGLPRVKDSKVEGIIGKVGGTVARSRSIEEARPSHIAQTQTDPMVDVEKAAQLPLPRLVTGTGQGLQASIVNLPVSLQQSDSSSVLYPPTQNQYYAKKRAARPPSKYTDLTPTHKCLPDPAPASSKSTTTDLITHNLNSNLSHPTTAIPVLPFLFSGVPREPDDGKTQGMLQVEEMRAAKRQRTVGDTPKNDTIPVRWGSRFRRR